MMDQQDPVNDGQFDFIKHMNQYNESIEAMMAQRDEVVRGEVHVRYALEAELMADRQFRIAKGVGLVVVSMVIAGLLLPDPWGPFIVYVAAGMGVMSMGIALGLVTALKRINAVAMEWAGNPEPETLDNVRQTD